MGRGGSWGFNRAQKKDVVKLKLGGDGGGLGDLTEVKSPIIKKRPLAGD